MSEKKTTKKTTAKKTTKKATTPKKTTKKGAAKKTSPKVATKKTAPKAPAKKDGLRKPQLRILQALSKAKSPITRKEIAAKAPVDVAGCTEWIGSHDPEKRAANDKKHFPSLLSLGYVKAEQHDVDGQDVIVYSLTTSGRKALKDDGGAK